MVATWNHGEDAGVLAPGLIWSCLGDVLGMVT